MFEEFSDDSESYGEPLLSKDEEGYSSKKSDNKISIKCEDPNELVNNILENTENINEINKISKLLMLASRIKKYYPRTTFVDL